MRIYSANSCTELSKTEIFPVSFANAGSKQKQEMPSRQQKSEKKGSERYLMFGPNHIFVISRWDDGRFPCRENLCRWIIHRYKYLVGPSELRNRKILGKCSKWYLNFQNWSNKMCLGVSETTKWLAAQSTANRFPSFCVTDKVNRHSSKKMKK